MHVADGVYHRRVRDRVLRTIAWVLGKPIEIIFRSTCGCRRRGKRARWSLKHEMEEVAGFDLEVITYEYLRSCVRTIQPHGLSFTSLIA